MKPLNFMLFTILALVLAAPLVPALAQKPTPRQNLAAILALTPTQRAQMNVVLVKALRQRRAVEADRSLTPAACAAKKHILDQSMNAQMLALLSPAQRTKVIMQQQAQGVGRP